MSLELCVLGSGSSGNSTLFRAPRGAFLVDAGFGPRVTAQRMHGTGLDVADISAILLTHLDHDHFNPNWLQTIVKLKIPVYCARKKVKELLTSPEARDLAARAFPLHLAAPRFEDLVVPFDGEFEPLTGVRVEPLELAHDSSGSHGFLLRCNDYRVGFATDLGHVPDHLIERFAGVDALALESNYDPDMELNSPRPWHLKQRIMGGQGHLSNEQALAAVRAILDRTAATCGTDRMPHHIILLHRSRQCNCPELVRKLFARDPRIPRILTLTDQYERTPWLSARQPGSRPATQLSLAWA